MGQGYRKTNNNMTIEIVGKQVLITSPCTEKEVLDTNSIYIAKKIREGIVEGALIGVQGRWDVVQKVDEKAVQQQTVLEEAQNLIYGDRQKAYGSAAKNFTDIGVGWANILGVPVSAEQVALCMAWLKVCRITAGLSRGEKVHRDSMVDLAGYAGCLEKIGNGQ